MHETLILIVMIAAQQPVRSALRAGLEPIRHSVSGTLSRDGPFRGRPTPAQTLRHDTPAPVGQPAALRQGEEQRDFL